MHTHKKGQKINPHLVFWKFWSFFLKMWSSHTIFFFLWLLTFDLAFSILSCHTPVAALCLHQLRCYSIKASQYMAGTPTYYWNIVKQSHFRSKKSDGQTAGKQVFSAFFQISRFSSTCFHSAANYKKMCYWHCCGRVLNLGQAAGSGIKHGPQHVWWVETHS